MTEKDLRDALEIDLDNAVDRLKKRLKKGKITTNQFKLKRQNAIIKRYGRY